MSKKGPRSEAFSLLTSSLSEEVIARYLELAYQVRDKELARRREMERMKAAIRRQKAAEAAARAAALAAALGIELPKPPGPVKKSKAKSKKKKGKKSPQIQKEVVPPTGFSGRLPAGNEASGPAEPLARANPSSSKKAKPITREDILKLVVADSLGYLDKVREDGWGGLTCAESGRVGGMMTRRMKRLEKGLPPV